MGKSEFSFFLFLLSSGGREFSMHDGQKDTWRGPAREVGQNVRHAWEVLVVLVFGFWADNGRRGGGI